MRFLARLRAAWLYTKYSPYIEEADAEDFWTPADARWLSTMFGSYSGQKLKLRLRNYAISSAMNAVRDQSNTVYASGVAAGIAMGINAIDTHLSHEAADSLTTETSSEDAALDGLEQLAA